MKKKYIKLLTDIQKEVPQELRDGIMKKVDRYEFIRELMRLGIADDEFPQEKKEYYKNILATGQMDIIDEEVDEEVTKKIDEFINKRILEEIEKKNLPKYAFKELLKKIKKHERNNIPTN